MVWVGYGGLVVVVDLQDLVVLVACFLVKNEVKTGLEEE